MVNGDIAQDLRHFYVYVIFRPNGVPCYVGKGRGGRWLVHAKKTHNPHLQHIFDKAGGSLPIAKIREGLTNAEACETEIALIAALGRTRDGGCLANVTLGGDGCTGHSQSEETRNKKREKLKGRPRPPNVVEAVKRGWENITPARRANMSAAQKGKKQSKETRKKQSEARKGIKLSPERCDAISKRMKGRPMPEKARARLKEYWESPEGIAAKIAHNAGNKYGIGNKRTPEGQARVNAAVSRANRGRIATPEYREKRRQIAKAIHAARKTRDFNVPGQLVLLL